MGFLYVHGVFGYEGWMCWWEKEKEDHSWEDHLFFIRNVVINDLFFAKIRKIPFYMK